MKLSDIKPNEGNPRYIKDAQFEKLVKSIRDFPRMLELRPIVINGDGVIVGGNMRYRALLEIGYGEVDDSWIKQASDFTPEELREFVIKDNLPFGDWDWEELANNWDEEDLEGWGLEIPGFEGETEQPSEEDESVVEKLLDEVGKVESRVKPGEIWQLGRHKIACGDSTVESNVRALLGDRFGDVGMVWADAPYGMRLDADFSGAKSRLDFAQDKKAFGGNKYENVIGDHEDFDPRAIIEMFQKKDQFWWGADYYAERLPNKNDGSWFVWDKRVEESMDAVYGSGFELCWSIKKHKRQLVRVKWAGIFGMEKEDTRSRVHPTQKPSDLCSWFFEKYGKDDDLIFDPFLGSAPSIIAAQKMEGDRTVYGFELSPDYCTVILERWEKFTGDTAKLIGTLPD